jgi:LPS-assembly protein
MRAPTRPSKATELRTDSCLRAATLLIVLFSAHETRAGDMCPAPPHHVPRSSAEVAADDHQIHIDADGFSWDAEGNLVLNGHVVVKQEDRELTADAVNYSTGSGHVTVNGAVDFEDPLVRVQSESGSYDQGGGADFQKSTFELLDRAGRGSATDIAVRQGGKIAFEQVRYTTCPVGDKDWMLQASSINLDTVLHAGVARGAWVEFKGVPIFYTPYLSFPMDSQRKSGLLTPILDHSGTNGYELGVAYYFNLAPNYDLTLTPEYLSARGVELGSQFRYLTQSSHGQVDANVLPNDTETKDDRFFFHAIDTTDFKPGLRGEVDLAAVSDSTYFEDFGVGSEETSVTYLERRADLKYYDDYWRIQGELQNFQTIDTTVFAYERPYSRVPRIDARGLFPLGESDFEFSVDSEAVNFMRNLDDIVNGRPLTEPSGVRLGLTPEFRWNYTEAGYHFVPSVGWHLTQYSLQDAGAFLPSNDHVQSAPFRSIPYGTLDTGLIFERESGTDGERTQTLEPRLVYTYVPYRNQNNLPVFDTALPDLNLSELFRTNRYVGDDRISDANQLAAGVTTRLFDQNTGQQLLAGTLGQVRYFSVPKVGLPCPVPVSNVQQVTYPSQLGLPCSSGELFNASDIVGDVSLTAYKKWTVNLDYVWNPYLNQTAKSEFSVQYRPDSRHVVNLAYRYQKDTFEQWDASVAWPIAAHWGAVGRLVYSIMDKQTIEQVAGFEYKSCCWRIQIVQRRYVDNRPAAPTAANPNPTIPPLGQSIAVELQLIGLSSVGKTSNAFLERSISGYSAGDQVP